MITPETVDLKRLRVVTAIVEDHPGVLSRVSGLVRRRGFNIQGLSVGPTGVPGRSRMTLTVDAGYAEADQVEKQLDRLIEVIELRDVTDSHKLLRELAMVKVTLTAEREQDITAEVQSFGGRLLATEGEEAIYELSGEFEAVERFLEVLRPFGILDIARSGPVAMSGLGGAGGVRAGE